MEKNIAIIGMPGCGKTTVGSRLARVLDCRFIDTDLEITKSQNKRVSQIFSEYGESFFRMLETKAVTDAANAKGAVIATGGGVVLREENMRLLEEKCLIVYIRRDIDKILSHFDDKSRPLFVSQPEKLYQVYEERHELYEKYSHIIIENDADADSAVKKIAEAIKSAPADR